jgi:hypothetical protein
LSWCREQAMASARPLINIFHDSVERYDTHLF